MDQTVYCQGVDLAYLAEGAREENPRCGLGDHVVHPLASGVQVLLIGGQEGAIGHCMVALVQQVRADLAWADADRAATSSCLTWVNLTLSRSW